MSTLREATADALMAMLGCSENSYQQSLHIWRMGCDDHLCQATHGRRSHCARRTWGALSAIPPKAQLHAEICCDQLSLVPHRACALVQSRWHSHIHVDVMYGCRLDWATNMESAPPQAHLVLLKRVDRCVPHVAGELCPACQCSAYLHCKVVGSQLSVQKQGPKPCALADLLHLGLRRLRDTFPTAPGCSLDPSVSNFSPTSKLCRRGRP